MSFKSAALAVAAVVLAAGPSIAQSAPAACPEPSERPLSVLRPTLPPPPAPPPPCMNRASGTHTCKKAVIDKYNAGLDAYGAHVKAYNLANRAYLKALNTWGESISNYTQCEIDLMNADVDILNNRN